MCFLPCRLARVILSISSLRTQPTTVAELEPLIAPENVVCNASKEEIASALLELTNLARGSEQICSTASYPSVSELAWDDSLEAAAIRHSLDMATHNFYSHTGSDGSKASTRALEEGFTFSYVGENIAAGQRTTGSAQSGWLQSVGHCVNIMRTNYTHMGAACVEDSGADYSRYWTVVFGRK